MSTRTIGLISGTSLDGVDAVLADFTESPRLIHALRLAYDPDLMADVRTAADPKAQLPSAFIGQLDASLGAHFARAALEVMKQAGCDPGEISAIGSHGQTIAHDPGGAYGFSTQLADPNRIVETTGITTVADFRRRDIAAGGQGAPLACAFHAAVFGAPGVKRAVLNLGGIANVTLLPGDGSDVIGFDTGPANCLLDAWSQRHLNAPFDANGEWAAGGQVDRRLLEKLLDDTYFAQSSPKSTGTQYFNLSWLDTKLDGMNTAPADMAATLVELSVLSIKKELERTEFDLEELIVCGGGAHNDYLMLRLQQHFPGVISSEAFGIAPDWVEAMAFAWLACETLAGRPGNLPSVTGADGSRVLGAIYGGTNNNRPNR